MNKKPKNENKADRFKRVATARVNKIISMIRLLGNCSTPSTYEFTTSQVNYIFSALQAELDKAKVNRHLMFAIPTKKRLIMC